MIKDTIVQFICFVTQLRMNDFMPKWEEYSNRLPLKKQDGVLLGQSTEAKNKFRYISRYEWPAKDFQSTLMKGQKAANFPEHTIKAVQVGGYTLLQTKNNARKSSDEVAIMAFISHDENDIDFYYQLSCRQFTIYQAYYESCLYGYVAEWKVPVAEADEWLLQLKQRPGIEAGIYKECLVAQD